MNRVSVRCPGKINLSLDVVGKREDGYHELKMIMQSIGLYDEITIEKVENGIFVSGNKSNIPVGENNICYKVAKIMIDEYKLNGGLNIFINKNIPIAAGLAGGSTDAAGVIEGINELFGLNLTVDEMMKIGVRVGADVPFCIFKGTALAEGIGEKLTRLKEVKTWCVLAKPDIDVSTKSVFGSMKLDEVVKRPNTDLLLEYIDDNDLENLSQNMVNVLETVTMKQYPVIFEIKNIMMEFNALGSLMSGSGPTVFGLFHDKPTAEKCYHRLRDYLKEVYLVSTDIG